MRALILTKYPIDGASSRYCVLQYLPWFRAHGLVCDSYPLYSQSLHHALLKKGGTAGKSARLGWALLKRVLVVLTSRRYDVVIMHREALTVGPPFLERLIRRRGIPIIFTYDDALFMFKSNKVSRMADWFKRPGKYLEIFRLANCVVAANPWLRDAAAEYCEDSRYLPLAEDLERITDRRRDQAAPKVPDASVTLGWIGSPSTERYLGLIGDVLRKLCQRYPGLKLCIVGGGGFELPGVPVERHGWTMEDEVPLVHSFDIGLMPLPNEDWSQGKSGGKARLYMATGTPAVCTAIGYNKVLIDHSRTGFLADTQEDWLNILDELIRDPQRRNEVGRAARKEVEDNYSIDAIAPRFLKIIHEVVERNAAVIGTRPQ